MSVSATFMSLSLERMCGEWQTTYGRRRDHGLKYHFIEDTRIGYFLSHWVFLVSTTIYNKVNYLLQSHPIILVIIGPLQFGCYPPNRYSSSITTALSSRFSPRIRDHSWQRGPTPFPQNYGFCSQHTFCPTSHTIPCGDQSSVLVLSTTLVCYTAVEVICWRWTGEF